SEAAPAAPSAAPVVVTTDELKRFRTAKAFIHETIVDALGGRAFLFTLKLERCSTREDLARLLPDYAKAIRKFRGESETQLIVERAKALLAEGGSTAHASVEAVRTGVLDFWKLIRLAMTDPYTALSALS